MRIPNNSQHCKEEILELSKKHHLSHIGSNLSCLPILLEIYQKKKPEDIVILDNAHSHLAHLVVEKYFDQRFQGVNIENIFINHGIHCDRKAGCDASGGSLGHGLGIGIGYALADRKRGVYVIVSDGSMMEGSGYEAIRIASENNLKNLHIYANFNGFTAVAEVARAGLIERMTAFNKGLNLDIKFFETSNTKDFDGVQGHYMTIE